MSESSIQLISLFLANAGMVVWFRSESRSDWRHMDAKLDAMHAEIHAERKDFHGRLCSIEERRAGK
jgi:hypothetical protein